MRLFINYCGGIPGIGLLLLRLANVSALASLVPASFQGMTSVWGAVLLLAIALLLGVMTRVNAWLIAAAQVVQATSVELSIDHWTVGAEHAVCIMQALALGCLGPGAYSLDAKWFGRRLIFQSSDE